MIPKFNSLFDCVGSKMTKKIEKNLKGKISHNSSNFFYVGIGASAGGLDALQKFLSNVPEKVEWLLLLFNTWIPSIKVP
jgi:chemotaxis response regulator CheB